MTNINGINKMAWGSADWKQIHEMTSDFNASKIDDDETLFKTMQYYEVSNRSDSWSADAQNLDVEDLIKLWKEFDKDDTSFAQDFDDFDAYLSSYKKPEPDPPVEEDIIRPYIPGDVTPEQKQRMEEFDKMRANDVHAKLDKEGDYETLLEYVRQREGTSFLYPSDYNADGTVNDKGKAKEAEMIAKLEELDKADNALGDVLEAFLEAYNVEEPTGASVNGELPDVKDVLKDLAAGASTELVIGDNKYLVTNNGADGNELAYEVKTNEKGQKYIDMTGDNWRIQDISGQLQDDLIQMNGQGNELDLGLGDDIAYLVGNDNRALMGDGDDKVYIEGDNAFTDLWRGDDKMFNINSDNTMGVGFTGDDEFYLKGENVLVSGETNTAIGDGMYEDGTITDHEIENELTRPEWFPKDEPPVDPPVDPPVEPEKIVVDDDVIIEIDGIKYEVYRKFGTESTENLTYYKAEDGRTVFESNGWNVTVISEMNTTGDEKYADVVVIGNGNSFFGSNGNDSIEIQGDNNRVHGDTSDVNGGNDNVVITAGTKNYVYGESGEDTVSSATEGNIFNNAILDVEKVNGEIQDLTPTQKPSSWQPVTEPTEAQTAQMTQAKEAFGLPADATVSGVKQNGSFMGMTIDGKAYISQTNADGKVDNIVQKQGDEVLAKVEYDYSAKGTTTTMLDYVKNMKTVTNPGGTKTETVYEDIDANPPVTVSQTVYDKDGNQTKNSVVDKANNTVTTKTGDKTYVTTYDDVASTDKKATKQVVYDASGKVINTKTYDYEKNTITQENADGTKVVNTYDNVKNTATRKTATVYNAEGKETCTNTYKDGQVDMKFPVGNVMSLDDFYKAVDVNKDSKLTATEIMTLYNKTNDPTLKGVLSNFTNGYEMTFAFELACTGTGRNEYGKGDKTIDKGDAADIGMIAKDGIITSDSIKALQANAAYAALVGYEVGNQWYVNGNNNDGVMTTQNPAYALTDDGGKTYNPLVMAFLNEAGGNSINREDLAKFGITTAADFQNDKLFDTIRAASDMVGALGAKPNANKPNATVLPVTAQGILDTYNATEDANLKKLCLESGAIEVGTDGVARVKDGMTNTSQVDSKALFKKALAVLNYPKEVK